MNFALQALKQQRAGWLKSHKFAVLFLGLELILFVLSAQLATTLLNRLALPHSLLVLAIAGAMNWLLAWSVRSVCLPDYRVVSLVIGCPQRSWHELASAAFSFAPMLVLLLPSLFFVSVELDGWLPLAKFAVLLALLFVPHWLAVRGQVNSMWALVYGLLVCSLVQPFLAFCALVVVAVSTMPAPTLPYRVKLATELARLTMPHALLLALGFGVAHQFSILLPLVLPLTLGCCLLAFLRVEKQLKRYRLDYLQNDPSSRYLLLAALFCVSIVLVTLGVHQLWLGYLFLGAIIALRLFNCNASLNALVIGLSFIYGVVNVLLG